MQLSAHDDDLTLPADLARYVRQMRFAPLGEEGQRRLAASRALLCGCGALGSAIANTLVRAGVGTLRIVDRDFVELSNLQRQVAVRRGRRGGRAAEGRGRGRKAAADQFHGDRRADRGRRRAGEHRSGSATGVDVILDGTDNFETRFLINDAAVKLGHAVDLRRLRGGRRADDDHPARRNALPALPDARVPRAGQHAHLRHGRHPRPDRRRDRVDRGRRGDEDPQRQPRGHFPPV